MLKIVRFGFVVAISSYAAAWSWRQDAPWLTGVIVVWMLVCLYGLWRTPDSPDSNARIPIRTLLLGFGPVVAFGPLYAWYLGTGMSFALLYAAILAVIAGATTVVLNRRQPSA